MLSPVKLYDLNPEEVLPDLSNISKDDWSTYLRKQLIYGDSGKALIALALWHKDENAPFNEHTFQRDFWGKGIRHSLGSYTSIDSVSIAQGYLTPIALILMDKTISIEKLIDIVHTYQVSNDMLAVKALQIISNMDLLKAAEIAQSLLNSASNTMQLMSVAILGDLIKTCYQDSRLTNRLKAVIAPLYLMVLDEQTDFAIMNQVIQTLSFLPEEVGKLVLLKVIQHGHIDAIAAAIDYMSQSYNLDSKTVIFLQDIRRKHTNEFIKSSIDRTIQPVIKTESTILLIDDDNNNLLLYRRILIAEDWTCFWATDGVIALDLFRQNVPQIVMTDMVMPGMSGNELAQKIRDIAYREGLGQPVILCCSQYLSSPPDGMTSEQFRDYLMDVGFDGVISKPIDIDTFVEQLEQYL